MMRFGSSLSSSPPPLRTLERRVCCVRLSSCVPSCVSRVQHSTLQRPLTARAAACGSRPPTGIGGVHGRSKALKGVVVCSNKRARQPFGNDRLLSLLGFGNVMFDSVGCVQQPRWGRLVRWRLATTFPPVRLLARGPATVPVGSMVAGNSHRAAAPGQPGHADPVSSTCDGRRGSAGSLSLGCL